MLVLNQFISYCAIMLCCVKSKVRSSSNVFLDEVDLEDVQLGDLIEIKRYYGIYAHWALYIGKGEVIHLSPPVSSGRTFDLNDIFWLGGVITDKYEFSTDVRVRKDKLEEIIGNGAVTVNNEFDPPRKESIKPFPKDEIVKRAYSKMGDDKYNLLSYNCEHFVTEYRYCVAFSKQVWDDDVPKVEERACVVAIPGHEPIPPESLPKHVTCVKRTR
ncbi:phospholipase A and acyltransferase 3-like [Mercenaria mercenaria]|uniref:phospholipase A and acyltransferase 3-like n=1 Tax=Mercenaria mercenaria TaxID=6596 RepID=UPI00234F853E|nr:phospholipase A and acyltransferase 3-like [Mercenaria mercenaria]